jgi:uncharacterized protein YkwD
MKLTGLARWAFALAVLATGAAGTMAEACAGRYPAAAGAAVPHDSAAIDNAVLDAAILVATNRARCGAGLPALAPAPTLRPVAQMHALWMARSATLSHAPMLPGGMHALAARLASGGFVNRAGAENIAMVHRFALDGRPVFVRNAAACQFTDRQGRVIAAHSYASLAEHLVSQWMASPGHRANLLSSRLTQVAHAAAIAPHRATCGQVYAVQLFTG